MNSENKKIKSNGDYLIDLLKNEEELRDLCKESLIPKRKPNERICDEVRELIRSAYNEGLPMHDVAELFDVSTTSVCTIVHERPNAEEGNERKKRKIGRKSVFDDPENIVATMNVIECPSERTLGQIADKVREDSDIEISVSALSRFLHEVDVTWKKSTEIPDTWNSTENIKLRMEYMQKLTQLLVNNPNIIYIGFTGLHFSCAEEKIELFVKPKTNRVNVIGAIYDNRIQHIKTTYEHFTFLNEDTQLKGEPTAEEFNLFLFRLASSVPKGQLVIMDARINNANWFDEKSWKMIEEVYEWKKFFLPPCSPFLNPMEYCFNYMKEIIPSRELPSDFQAENFEEMVKKELYSLSKEKIISIVERCNKLRVQSLAGISIKGNILDPEIPENII